MPPFLVFIVGNPSGKHNAVICRKSCLRMLPSSPRGYKEIFHRQRPGSNNANQPRLGGAFPCKKFLKKEKIELAFTPVVRKLSLTELKHIFKEAAHHVRNIRNRKENRGPVRPIQ
jgi:hypothetical protein